MEHTEHELRRLIVKACRALSEKNLVTATDGNLSARLGPDRILATPTKLCKADVGERDLVICDMDRRKIRGRGEASTEIQLHFAAYRARPEIGAVVHAHPPTATAFTLAGKEHLLSEPIVLEVVALFGKVLTVPYITPGTNALAEAAGACFKNSDLVLLARHGAVTLGADPWAAYLRMEKLEYLAVVVKLALELAGGDASAIHRFGPREVALLQKNYGGGRRANCGLQIADCGLEA